MFLTYISDLYVPVLSVADGQLELLLVGETVLGVSVCLYTYIHIFLSINQSTILTTHLPRYLSIDT
jgi:hypothetical protein